jgi:cobalamin synthase
MADSLDGFGGGWGRAQILRIMRDSRVGTYALVGMAILLQIRITAIQALQGEPRQTGLLFGWELGAQSSGLRQSAVHQMKRVGG